MDASDIWGIADRSGVKLTAKRCKLLQTALAEREVRSEPLVRRVRRPAQAEVVPLYGRYETRMGGRARTVEYEPDPELRDSEQAPLPEEPGMAAFIRREGLLYAPDAWVDADATKIGYEISFNRHFYKPQPLRTLDEIRAEILARERDTDGLLSEILGEEAP